MDIPFLTLKYALSYLQIYNKCLGSEHLIRTKKNKNHRLVKSSTNTIAKRRPGRMPSFLDRRCNNCTNSNRSSCKLCIECNDDTCNLKCIRTICRRNMNNRQRVLFTRQWMTSVFGKTEEKRLL